MLEDIHDLIHELPEYRERIQELRAVNPHFEKLHDQYNELDQRILKMEEGYETPSDDYLEELKKTRLNLKDQLVNMIKN
ncbi:MAG: DUF465 domain-containing protein [Gammaproteobacteria bacterium]|nr:DUF465 domain-containing protein [Gammaproteobacteria bacterium]